MSMLTKLKLKVESLTFNETIFTQDSTALTRAYKTLVTN